MKDERKTALRMVRFWLKRCDELGVNVNGVNAQKEKQEEGKRDFPPAPPIERKGEEEKKDLSPNACAREEFCRRFWELYPIGHKTAKRKCFNKLRARFNAAKDPAAFAQRVLDGLVAWRRSQRWLDGFICNPETFINQERWQDDPPMASASSRPRRGISQTANYKTKEVATW